LKNLKFKTIFLSEVLSRHGRTFLILAPALLKENHNIQDSNQLQMLCIPSFKSFLPKKAPCTIKSTRSSKDIQPPPQDRNPKPADQNASMSDHDLLKNAFRSSVDRSRMGARSWMSERGMDVYGTHR
jgi:hypothetical protein